MLYRDYIIIYDHIGEIMRIRFTRNLLLRTRFFALLLCLYSLILQPISAEIINIPLQRSVATQPITSLEIIAIVKTLLNGRVLSIKKKSSYSNPDCHTVKFLGDKGEFQVIKVSCYIDVVTQNKP